MKTVTEQQLIDWFRRHGTLETGHVIDTDPRYIGKQVWSVNRDKFSLPVNPNTDDINNCLEEISSVLCIDIDLLKNSMLTKKKQGIYHEHS